MSDEPEGPKEEKLRSLLMWLITAFAALMALYSMQQGDWSMALVAFVVLVLAALGR